MNDLYLKRDYPIDAQEDYETVVFVENYLG